MNNPTKEGNYTTIFRDGSVILENPWLIRPDGNGKWYWNEECRGGVIAWNEIPEGGYNRHKWYKLSEDDLYDLIYSDLTISALMDAGIENEPIYDWAIKIFCNTHNVDTITALVEREMNTGYYSGYEIKE